MKCETVINLPSIAAVKEFVGYCNEMDGDIDLYSGKYIVDGKSIMGIFSLDLSKPIELKAEGSERSIEAFMGKIKHFEAD